MKTHQLGKLTEGYWPWGTSMIVALVSPAVFGSVAFSSETETRLLEKLVDVCAIGVGFWTTALALLLALESRETIEVLRTLGLYSKVADYFLVTIYSFFSLLIFCILNMADFLPNRLTHGFRVALWSFLLSITVSSMLRSLHLLRKLLKAR